MRIVIEVDHRQLALVLGAARKMATEFEKVGTADHTSMSRDLRDATSAMSDEANWIAVHE